MIGRRQQYYKTTRSRRGSEITAFNTFFPERTRVPGTLADTGVTPEWRSHVWPGREVRHTTNLHATIPLLTLEKLKRPCLLGMIGIRAEERCQIQLHFVELGRTCGF